MTALEVKLRDEKMQAKPCFAFCQGCEGCSNFSSNQQKCVNCAPEYRACLCGQGTRRFLTSDGFIAVTQLTDRRGERRDVGKMTKVRKVVSPPLLPRDIPRRFSMGGT